MSELYRTIRDASLVTGVPESTLRRWVREGQVPHTRQGRTILVNVEDIPAERAALLEHTDGPQPNGNVLEQLTVVAETLAAAAERLQNGLTKELETLRQENRRLQAQIAERDRVISAHAEIIRTYAGKSNSLWDMLIKRKK